MSIQYFAKIRSPEHHAEFQKIVRHYPGNKIQIFEPRRQRTAKRTQGAVIVRDYGILILFQLRQSAFKRDDINLGRRQATGCR